MSNVRSAPLHNGSITSAARTLQWRAAGLVALALGAPLWLIGARFTILGAPKVIAAIFGLFRIAVALALPSGWPLLGLTIIVGALISLVEFGCRPRRRFFAESLLIGLILFAIWLAVNAGDIASTFVGVTTPQPDSWPITRWIATTVWVAGAWTLILTYVPELLIIAGVRWLIRGRF